VRKLLAVLVLASAVGAAQELPRRVGDINDYGQTLERSERERLATLIAQAKAKGVALVYLASWHDPFANPSTYVREVFRAWSLPPEAVLVVFLRGDNRRWKVVSWAGPTAQKLLPEQAWLGLLSEAETRANRGQPAHGVIALAEDLLELLTQGSGKPAQPSTRFPVLPVLLGLAGVAGLFLLGRHLLCPHCFRPLERRRSYRGTIAVCPRCRWTRAGGWGRWSGSRGS